ncbi:hypothetical protein BY996DRAFT_6442682 [Phakopsora pachyrhizi]|nr:hypothetical protein BY996DRAFT_6442682 [Phakopsora pachyrhizi]
MSPTTAVALENGDGGGVGGMIAGGDGLAYDSVMVLDSTGSLTNCKKGSGSKSNKASNPRRGGVSSHKDILEIDKMAAVQQELEASYHRVPKVQQGTTHQCLYQGELQMRCKGEEGEKGLVVSQNLPGRKLEMAIRREKTIGMNPGEGQGKIAMQQTVKKTTKYISASTKLVDIRKIITRVIRSPRQDLKLLNFGFFKDYQYKRMDEVHEEFTKEPSTSFNKENISYKILIKQFKPNLAKNHELDPQFPKLAHNGTNEEGPRTKPTEMSRIMTSSLEERIAHGDFSQIRPNTTHSSWPKIIDYKLHVKLDALNIWSLRLRKLIEEDRLKAQALTASKETILVPTT